MKFKPEELVHNEERDNTSILKTLLPSPSHPLIVEPSRPSTTPFNPTPNLKQEEEPYELEEEDEDTITEDNTTDDETEDDNTPQGSPTTPMK